MRKPDRRSGPDRPGPRRSGRSDRRPEQPDTAILYGWHPVVEALRNPQRHLGRLLATDNAARRLAEAVAPLRLIPEIVRPQEIDRLVEADAVHQGLYLECDPLPSPDLASLPDDALVVALDQVTDPHNVGAILRSAAAFAATALLTTARHSPAATGVVAKAASGGLEHVPVIVVRNLAQALVELGERGFQRVGLDSAGDRPIEAITAKRPLVLVLGAEGKGLRQRTRALCDVIARLDMPGAIASLNVSNAAAVALFALTRPRGGAAPISPAEP